MSWRKKFKFQVAPSDKQLMAIGLVSAQWSIIERNLTTIAHGLYGDDTKARSEYDRMQNFRKRLRTVRDLVAARVAEPYRIHMLAHVDKIGSIVTERDKIIHGLWGSDDPPAEDPSTNHNATHAFNLGGHKPDYNWRLSYDAIMRVALKIDALAFELYNNLASVMGYPKQFLMSDALRKISRHDEGSSDAALP